MFPFCDIIDWVYVWIRILNKSFSEIHVIKTIMQRNRILGQDGSHIYVMQKQYHNNPKWFPEILI